MTLHTGLRMSFREQYARSSRKDLIDQVPEVESQDAAFARWQHKVTDRNVAAQVEARYREALGFENRAMARFELRLAKRLVSRLGALFSVVLAWPVWANIVNTVGNGGLFGGQTQSLQGWLGWAGEALVFSALAVGCVIWVYNDLRKPELKRATGIHQSLLAAHPDFASAACRLAYIWQVNNAVERSLQAAIQASRADPGFEMPYFCAGIALKSLGRPDEAATAYRKAIALNSKFAAARANLGLILVDRADFDGAVEQFTAMLRDFPDAKNATTNLGLAERQFTRQGHTRAEFQALLQRSVDRLADAYLG